MLVGLGNPGEKYRRTRHNVGFRFVEQVAGHAGVSFSAAARFRAETAELRMDGEKILLVKPQTFMNRSGEAVAALCHYHRLVTRDLFVVFDDLDLPCGKVRLRKGGGHGGHNGLRSLHQHLPDADYYRLKIGIGRPARGDVSAWVLSQADAGDQAVEARARDVLEEQLPRILAGDIAGAGNAIHLALQAS